MRPCLFFFFKEGGVKIRSEEFVLIVYFFRNEEHSTYQYVLVHL